MEKIILNGVAVYTSENLRKKFKEIVNDFYPSGMPSNIKSIVVELVDKKIIVPTVTEGNLLHKLIGIVKQHEYKHLYGKTTDDKKIYIFLHKGAKEKILIETLFHEMIHYITMSYYNKFVSINLPLIYSFYKILFTLYFDCKNVEKDSFDKFVSNMLKQEKTSLIHPKNYKPLEVACRKFSKLSEDDFDSKFNILLDFVFNDYNKPLTKKYEHLINTIIYTYYNLFKSKDLSSGNGQELYLPSEIISQLSTIQPNHSNVKKTLELLK